MCILFLPFDRCYMILPCYLHSIYIFCIIYWLWRWFFKLFLISTLKDQNLAENLTKAENLFKNLTPRSSWISFFPSLGLVKPVFRFQWNNLRGIMLVIRIGNLKGGSKTFLQFNILKLFQRYNLPFFIFKFYNMLCLKSH